MGRRRQPPLGFSFPQRGATNSGRAPAPWNPGGRSVRASARRGDPGHSRGAKRAAVPSARRGPAARGAPRLPALPGARTRGRGLPWRSPGLGGGCRLGKGQISIWVSTMCFGARGGLQSLLLGVVQLSEPALALSLPQGSLPAEDQAAGGEGLPLHQHHSLPPCGPGRGCRPMDTLTPGGHLPSPKGWGGARSFREFWRLLALASHAQRQRKRRCWGLSP